MLCLSEEQIQSDINSAPLSNNPSAQSIETSDDPPAQSAETSDDLPVQSTETSDDPSAQSMELCNASPLSDETSTQGPLRVPLTDLYDERYELLSAADLQISAEKVFLELSITNVESQEIHVCKVKV